MNIRPPSGNVSLAPDAIVNYVLDARALTTPLAGLQIGRPDEAPTFAGRLRVESSDDLGEWRTLVDAAPIANLRAGEDRLIERRIETRYSRAKFLRLSWVGESAPFEINSVTAEPAGDRHEVGRPSFAVEGVAVPGKPGEFEFDLGAHFPVDRVNFSSCPSATVWSTCMLFSRPTPKSPWRQVAHRGFYRVLSSTTELMSGDVAGADRHGSLTGWRA